MHTSDLMRSNYVVFDRRRFLAAAAGLVAAGILPKSVLAQAAPHSFKQGALELTVVSDGQLVIPTNILAVETPPEDLRKLLEAAGIGAAEFKAEASPLIVKSGSDIVLFDTGSGGNFQPTSGKLVENLKAAGVDPGSITKVVFTHAHPDHMWGTVGADGALPFPNATYHVAAAEWDFWTAPDLAGKMPAEMQPMVNVTQKVLAAVKDKVMPFKPGDEVVGGVRTIDTAGHTPGHVSFEVPGDELLIIVADAVPMPVTMFPHPEWKFAYDADQNMAVEARKKLLDRAATDKIRLLGFHWPYPGLGYAERDGNAYRYVAAS